jgi:hypothetical protein
MVRDFAIADLADVNAWHCAHGRPGMAASHVPQTGRIVPGVAAGFLYVTDSDVALLEGYVTNPEAPLRERSKAVDEITHALLAEAKDLGMGRVVALCASGGIARRAGKFGLQWRGSVQFLAREV